MQFWKGPEEQVVNVRTKEREKGEVGVYEQF